MANLLNKLRNIANQPYGISGPTCDTVNEAVAEIERLRALLVEATTNPEGDYYLGLRCGIEDRDIYDRYDAAEYGWDQAFEYVESVAALGSVITPQEGDEK